MSERNSPLMFHGAGGGHVRSEDVMHRERSLQGTGLDSTPLTSYDERYEYLQQQVWDEKIQGFEHFGRSMGLYVCFRKGLISGIS